MSKQNNIALGYSISDSNLNKLIKDVFTIKRQWGPNITNKIYPFVDKDILSKRIAR